MASLTQRKPLKGTAEADPNYEKTLSERGKEESKCSKLVTRLITGWIMIFAFLGILYIGHTPVLILVAVLQVILFNELTKVRYNAAQAKNVPLFRTLQWCWFGSAMYYVYSKSILDFLVDSNSALQWTGVNSEQLVRYHAWSGFSLYVVLFVVSVLSMKKGSYKYQMSQLTWTIISIALIVIQMQYIVQNIFAGLFWFLVPASLVICNDCMAYFCGFAFGRKIFKGVFMQLSPNKTWEGFIGGGFWTIIYAWFWSLLLARWEWLTCPLDQLGATELHCTPNPVFVETTYDLPQALHPVLGATFTCLPVQIHALILGVFASLVAPFGGFLASAIKRAYEIKDFDSWIPGHGGIMDRMDCQMIMALGTAMHYSTFIAPQLLSVDKVMAAISSLSHAEQTQVFNNLQDLVGNR